MRNGSESCWLLFNLASDRASNRCLPHPPPPPPTAAITWYFDAAARQPVSETTCQGRRHGLSKKLLKQNPLLAACRVCKRQQFLAFRESIFQLTSNTAAIPDALKDRLTALKQQQSYLEAKRQDGPYNAARAVFRAHFPGWLGNGEAADRFELPPAQQDDK
eukprot:m.162812 g.162812  ORF g.162812 m.162812 type:complete len:161 (-) comp10304_c0_seq1:1103-1585(-)